MIFVWDEPKRLANLSKHGIDFADFENGFDFETALQIDCRPSRLGRRRFVFVGLLRRRLVSAVVSPLGAEALSLVSLRSASAEERRLYGK